MDNSSQSSKLSRFIKYELNRRGWNQEQLAELMKVVPSQVSKMINPTLDYQPKMPTYQKLAKAFNMNLNELLNKIYEMEIDEIEKEDQTITDFPLYTHNFFGRSREIAAITEAIASHRLILITGLAGIGKTVLVRNVLENLPNELIQKFENPIFCTVNDDYMIADIADYVNYKSANYSNNQTQLQPQLSDPIANILETLTKNRNLLVLDNLNLDHPEHGASYLQLLKQIAETNHKSCVIVTSQKHPIGFRAWQQRPQIISLKGLEESEAIKLLVSEGLSPQADPKFIKLIIQKYNGNPLGLKFAVQDIIELCHGELELYFKRSTMFAEPFGEKIREILHRLPALELELLYWLALQKEAIPFYQIRNDFSEQQRHIIDNNRINEMVKGLHSRSLLKSDDGNFCLPPEVQACTEKSLLEQLSQEIRQIALDGDINKLNWLRKLELAYEQIKLRDRLSRYLANKTLSQALTQLKLKEQPISASHYIMENLEYLLAK